MEETDLTTVRARARVGSLLSGRWHLDALVGVGGMAAVYAATHRNGKRVAIKILHPEFSVDDGARQRFLLEGYAANRVGHSGAVAADDDGTTEDGTSFLVMELLEGETLDQRSVRMGGRLPMSEVLALMDQVLATLTAAHEKSIVHRDLKPENLFLKSNGLLKVLDFGIARVQDSSGRSASQTQGIMGTPSFMAPEQARGRWEDVDARTDLWAVGATMFTLLSGRVVHDAETANEALVAAVTQRAPALAQVASHVHPAIAALVDKALCYEREGRFQSANAFREALRAVHAVHADSARDEPLPPISVTGMPVSSSRRTGTRRLNTVSGVAASVRSNDATGTATRKGLSKLRIGLALITALALAAVAARGLSGARSNPAQLALAAEARPASTKVYESPRPAAAAALEVGTAAAVVQTTVRVAASAAQSAPRALAHGVAHPAAPAVSAKSHPQKITADLFMKRH